MGCAEVNRVESEGTTKTPKPMFAQIFTMGNSQVVRLPRDFASTWIG